MRLAFITQDFPPETGGIQTYSFEIAKHLSSLCDTFILIAPAKKNQAIIDNALPYPVVRIPCSNTLLGFYLKRHLPKIIQEYKIDMTFHAQWQTLKPAIKAKRKGRLSKVMVAAHARELIFNPYAKIPVLKGWYIQHQITSLLGADQYFPVSHYTSNLLQNQGVHPSKIKVINNGTDTAMFFPIPIDSFKNEFGFSDKKILFTVCRHVERKGIQDVIRALPNVIKTVPTVHYIIGGSGPYTATLKELVEALELSAYVTFAGRIPDTALNQYYNLADVFIMTPLESETDIEGFGIVYLEANACGKPVIGSRTGGIPDAIKDQKTGLLVEASNQILISRAINQLLTNESMAKTLGQQGKEWVEKEMNWKAVTKRLFREIGR